ncbi:unnamed protein product [Paramecium octaurelia]|uniref:Uncharacterized protein n=1 Tax=Paramecium octaurelia TaxID=43137 RepID=A0A8S1W2R2_PAROT|nr:unnamed protein product [Paramecium octaurelia]
MNKYEHISLIKFVCLVHMIKILLLLESQIKLYSLLNRLINFLYCWKLNLNSSYTCLVYENGYYAEKLTGYFKLCALDYIA